MTEELRDTLQMLIEKNKEKDDKYLEDAEMVILNLISSLDEDDEELAVALEDGIEMIVNHQRSKICKLLLYADFSDDVVEALLDNALELIMVCLNCYNINSGLTFSEMWDFYLNNFEYMYNLFQTLKLDIKSF